jgi:7-cyano-7-deazaguanine reductase
MPEGPVHLGQKSILTPAQIEAPASILDTFKNPRPGRDYDIRFVFPEFTSMCPVTGQPDFATITISYTPADLCVEMKSLKLYFLAFRNKGIFYEGVANTILDDLVSKLSPRRMVVTADFNARGGTVGVITCRHGT